MSSVVITLSSLKINNPLFQFGEQIMPNKMFDILAPLPALAGLVGVLSRWQDVTMSSVVITLASLKITTPTPLIINYYGWGVWMIIISRPPRRTSVGRRAIAARSSKPPAPVHLSLPRRPHSVTFWCLGGGFWIYAKSWLKIKTFWVMSLVLSNIMPWILPSLIFFDFLFNWYLIYWTWMFVS